MVWTFHHILLDGWSLGQVFAEVCERYAALMKDWYERAPKALQLPPLPDEIYRAAVGATNELVVARIERPQVGASQPLEELVMYSLFALFGLTKAEQEALGPKR